MDTLQRRVGYTLQWFIMTRTTDGDVGLQQVICLLVIVRPLSSSASVRHVRHAGQFDSIPLRDGSTINKQIRSIDIPCQFQNLVTEGGNDGGTESLTDNANSISLHL